jgi:hypothetical protein
VPCWRRTTWKRTKYLARFKRPGRIEGCSKRKRPSTFWLNSCLIHPKINIQENVNNLVGLHISYNYCKKKKALKSWWILSPLRAPLNTACPLKTCKLPLSAYKLSASSTEPETKCQYYTENIRFLSIKADFIAICHCEQVYSARKVPEELFLWLSLYGEWKWLFRHA